jgi:hypothetical protein
MISKLPKDFDRGNASSGVNFAKKSFITLVAGCEIIEFELAMLIINILGLNQ